MAQVVLIEGPAGAGKDSLARRLRDAGEVSVFADLTAIWAAITGAVRDANGRYPERQPDDPGLHVARLAQVFVVTSAIRLGLSVAVTTARRNQAHRWRDRIAERGVPAPVTVRTLDPGRAEVVRRLAQPAASVPASEVVVRLDGNLVLSKGCAEAADRWYGPGNTIRGL